MSQNMSQNIRKDTERYGILRKTRVLEKRQIPTKQWEFWRSSKIMERMKGIYTAQYMANIIAIATLYIVCFPHMSHYYHPSEHRLTS